MKIAVITGASAGIGREFVYAIDKKFELDEIWVIARREERLQEVAEKCRNKVRPLVLDLLDTASIAAYQELLKKEQPQVQVLVNAAGFGVFGAFDKVDLEKQLLSVRLNSEVLTALCHVTIPFMKAGDHIINVGSNSAWQPVPLMAIYGASKSFVLNFSRALNREMRPRGISVMCVCPGWVRTEFQAKAKHDDYIRYVDRWFEPWEVAEQAMKDLDKGKMVSIAGAALRLQVLGVKLLPMKMVIETWCRQQGIE